MDKQPRKMTFSMMREVIEQSQQPSSRLPYVGSDIAMVRTNVGIVQNVMGGGSPLRIDDYRCGIIRQGEARLTINLIEKQLTAGMMAVICPGSIVHPVQVSPDFELEGVAVKHDLLHLALGGRLPDILTGSMRDYQMMPTDEQRMLTDQLLDTLWAVVHTSQHSRSVLTSLVAALFQHYDDTLRANSEANQTAADSRRDVFNRFIRLVNQHAAHEHQLAFYADRLCLSPRYLGTLIHEASDVTGKEWIDRAIISEAKVLLKHSDRQVTQIADDLSFPNTSFFCKYFKRLTGMTPNDYRGAQ